MNSERLSHRKSTIRIWLQGADGIPCSHTRVTFRQIKHEFLFGCGAFQTLNMMEPKSKEEQLFLTERMERWLEIFNFGTLPFYWQKFEPVQGKTIAPNVRAAGKWLQERGIRLKGHPLCWHTHTVPWLKGINEDQIQKALDDRIKREMSEFKDLISMWDVINEVVIMPVFEKEDNGITRLCRKVGRVELIRRVFEQAKACDQGACLLLNDFNTSVAYEVLIDACLNAGIPIDGIGIQSHQHQGYWGEEKLMEVLDRFSRFGLPIHFTENTFVSGNLMPPEITDLNDYKIPKWLTTPEGEERQAQNVEEFYRILFSHPQIEAITTWAFQDGAWLGAPAGLVREDNSIKPSYKVLKNLIRKEWWTEETYETSENGVIDFTGFKGDYLVAANGREHLFQLGNNSEIVLNMNEIR